MFYRDGSRRHRDRGYYPGYPPYDYYEDSDGYESIERYSYAAQKYKRSLCATQCLVCISNLREPFEAMSCYDPYQEEMEFVHKCFIATEAGRLITQDAADRIEGMSRLINRTYGYVPMFRELSRYMKQRARDVQLLPDQDPYWSRRPRRSTPYWFS